MRAQIERALGLTALELYGLSEIVGPGVAAECPRRAGLHVQEDHFLAEVVDPETGAPLPPGAEGELVLHHADQGGAADAALPHRRRRRARPRSRARAAARRRGWPASAAGATTC